MSEPVRSSGLRTADAAICARPCIYWGARVTGDGTNAASIVAYDHATAASGTAVDKVKIAAAGVWADSVPSVGVECLNGLYIDVAGTGAEYIVYFSLL